MVDKVANVATMEPEEYIEVRMGQLSGETQVVLGFSDPANKAQIAHMFSVEYIRLRHGMLEQNCLQFFRRYMGAMKALESAVGGKEAAVLFKKAMEQVPVDLLEVPQL